MMMDRWKLFSTNIIRDNWAKKKELYRSFDQDDYAYCGYVKVKWLSKFDYWVYDKVKLGCRRQEKETKRFLMSLRFFSFHFFILIHKHGLICLSKYKVLAFCVVICFWVCHVAWFPSNFSSVMASHKLVWSTIAFSCFGQFWHGLFSIIKLFGLVWKKHF